MGLIPRARGVAAAMSAQTEAAAAWAPTDVTGLVGWWDFSDETTLFTDAGSTLVSGDGDAIYQCNDKSGSGNNLLQSTAASRPLYKVNIQNGLSVARFDGADDFMSKAIAGVSSPFTVLGVINCTTGIDNEDILLWSGPTSSYWGVRYYSTPNIRIYQGSYLVGSGVSLDTFYIYTVLYNNASSIYRQNAAETTGDTGVTTGFEGVFLASNNGGSARWAESEFGELLVYSTAISATDYGNAESYLATKWGITLS